MLALREAPELLDAFAYDEMLRAPLLVNALPVATPVKELPRPVRDADVTATQEWLQLAGLASVSKDTVHQAVDLRATECGFHPVRDYLNGLAWDGVERLGGWLSDYCAPSKTTTRAASAPCLWSAWWRACSAPVARWTTC